MNLLENIDEVVSQIKHHGFTKGVVILMKPRDENPNKLDFIYWVHNLDEDELDTLLEAMLFCRDEGEIGVTH